MWRTRPRDWTALTDLLRDMLKQKGRMEAARTLRVNYKTLAAALQSGKLTLRLCDALEHLLMIRELVALEEVRESVKALVERLNELERVTIDRTWPRRSQPRQEFRRTDPSVVPMEPRVGESEIYGPARSPVKMRREPHLPGPISVHIMGTTLARSCDRISQPRMSYFMRRFVHLMGETWRALKELLRTRQVSRTRR